MKPISKIISYGYSKTVQLFEDSKKGCSKKYVVIVSNYGIDGDLCKLAEYRYDDYSKAVEYMYKIIVNFVFPDLYQR